MPTCPGGRSPRLSRPRQRRPTAGRSAPQRAHYWILALCKARGGRDRSYCHESLATVGRWRVRRACAAVTVSPRLRGHLTLPFDRSLSLSAVCKRSCFSRPSNSVGPAKYLAHHTGPGACGLGLGHVRQWASDSSVKIGSRSSLGALTHLGPLARRGGETGYSETKKESAVRTHRSFSPPSHFVPVADATSMYTVPCTS